MPRPALWLLLALAAAAPRAQDPLFEVPDTISLFGAMGIDFDRDGKLWVSCWQMSQLVKLDPAGPELARIGPEYSAPRRFNAPFALAASSTGDIYVSDGSVVLRFDASGSYVATIGSSGAGPGQFSRAGGLAVAPNGDLLVVDGDRDRVHRFDASGSFVLSFGATGAAPGQFEFGPADGYAVGITVAPNGDVWVVDPGNDRVQRLDPSGAPLQAFPVAPMSTRSALQTDIAVDSAGAVYVGQRNTPQLQKFDSAGNLLWQDATPGGVGGVAVDTHGDLWTADVFTNRVRRFDPNGNVLEVFGTPMDSVTDGRFNSLRGVVFGAAGSFWVADVSVRLQQFDASGAFVQKFSTASGFVGTAVATDAAGNLYVAASSEVEIRSAAGALLARRPVPQTPLGLAVAADGSLYVTQGTTHRVLVYDAAGALVNTLGGTRGSGPGQLDGPRGVAVAPDGTVLVCDANNSRVQRFDAQGGYLGEFGTALPLSIAVDSDGTTYVGGFNALRVFTSAGAHVLDLPAGGRPGEVGNIYGVAVAGHRLAVADATNNRVTIFQLAAPEPRGVALLDADGDGDLDVAVANSGSADLSMYRGDGAGGLALPRRILLGGTHAGPVALAAGDLDGDAAADDLAVACADSGTVALVIDAGGATPLVTSLAAGGARPVDVAVCDLDGDPRDDVVVALEGTPFSGGDGIAVSLNGGAFLPVTMPGGAPRKAVHLATGDLDGDGDQDFAVLVQGGTDEILLFTGAGDGSLTSAGAIALSTGGLARGLCCGDLDGDGDVDLAVVLPALFPTPATSLRIYSYTGSGALDATDYTASSDVATGGTFGVDVSFGDVDDDGLTDVAVVHAGSGDVLLLNGWSGSGFGSTSTPTVGDGPIASVFGDLDGDGGDDVVVVNQASGDVTVLRFAQRALAQGYGTGCAGTGGLVPELAGVGLPVQPSATFGVQLSQARAFVPSLLLFAADPDALSVGGGCAVLVQLPAASTLRFTNGLGTDTFVFGVPATPSLVGLDLYFQHAVFDPAGAYLNALALSNGLRVQVGS